MEDPNLALAYRLAALVHRLTYLEREVAGLKTMLWRAAILATLWLMALASNWTSGQISDLLRSIVKAGSLVL